MAATVLLHSMSPHYNQEYTPATMHEKSQLLSLILSMTTSVLTGRKINADAYAIINFDVCVSIGSHAYQNCGKLHYSASTLP